MRQRSILRLCAGVAAGLCAAWGQAQAFALKDQTTVVFYGDSITAQRLYTRFVEEAVLTRYPALHIQFVNAGVPGDTTYGGYAGAMKERVLRDVEPFHPAMITVMLGMNDGGYVPQSEKMDALFIGGYRGLLTELHKAAPDAAFTLIRPSPYDEITHGTDFPGYSQVVQRNAEDVSAIGAEMRASGGSPVVVADFHSALTDALKTANHQYPQLAPLIIPDRIHPGEVAHWMMAAKLLSAWHMDGVVSRLAIGTAASTGSSKSAESGVLQVLSKERTTVTGLQRTASGLRWTQMDEALPLPLDLNNAMTSVLLATSDIASLDQQTLSISGIGAGTYDLLIDGKSIGAFTAAQLQNGINLALYRTPMLDQARGIDWFEERRANLDQSRFVLGAEAKVTPSTSVAQDALRRAQDELAETIRTKIVPKSHGFDLRALPRPASR